MTTRVFTLAGKRVWVAGHRGMVGSALVRRLQGEACELVTLERAAADLRDQAKVEAWMQAVRPDVVFLAAAKVGGILANESLPAEFLYDNLMIEANVIHASFAAGVEKLIFLGSSCIYPKLAPQPIEESALLTGPLEPSNEAYAIAKIAGLKLCQAYRKQYGADFISAMPTNLYGPGDNFDLNSSHVLPALMRKSDDAKRLGAAAFTIWGTGSPRREFLHVDDGSGSDIPILRLAELIASTVGFSGRIETDVSKPDGTPRKLLNSRKLREMGWAPSISLPEGVASLYRWYLAEERSRI